jgi:polar amino acid transport system permease protein
MSSWGEFADNIPSSAATTSQNDAAFVTDVSGMLPLLAKGAGLTILLSALTAVIALFSGTLIGVGCIARSKIVNVLSTGYIALVRGTPLLVQLFISYFVIATLLNRVAGHEIMGAFGAALFALVLNTTAYNAETIRGGIASVEAGQWDAAATLGMRRPMLLKRIVLPQAFRNSLPSLGNNLVVLIKDTSLVGAITLIELTYSARNIVFQTGQAFVPFFVAAAFYLVIITSVSLAVRAAEARLGRGKRDARMAA